MTAERESQSSTSSVRRTSRAQHPKIVPALLQGRDGSLTLSPPSGRPERAASRRLSFCAPSLAEQRPSKRRASSSPPSSTESGGAASRDSRGTEVSSASVFRSSSHVDRSTVVLVTKTLRVRCDSLASSPSDNLSAQSPLAPSLHQASFGGGSVNFAATTPCSSLRAISLFSMDEDEEEPQLQGGSPRAGEAPPASPACAAALSFADWNAALRRSNGISNPLARPPLPLALPGSSPNVASPALPAFSPQSPAQQRASTKLSALDTMLQCVTAAEHRARCAASG